MYDLRKDCHYYYESQDMHAYVPCCELEKEFGSCPCKDCTRYVSKKEIKEVIENYLKNRK